MTNFFVGQHVVCVDVDDPPGYAVPLGPLILNTVYTIRDIVYPIGWDGVRLEEIIREIYESSSWNGGEIPYDANRFRPLVESRLDIFNAMLADTPVDAIAETV